MILTDIIQFQKKKKKNIVCFIAFSVHAAPQVAKESSYNNVGQGNGTDNGWTLKK